MISARLVVLGLFNEALHGDIFGPRLEAFLYGLFGSCMALAAFGTARPVIIARHEFVWYHPLASAAGRPNAVIRIDGNPRHSFREYRLGQ